MILAEERSIFIMQTWQIIVLVVIGVLAALLIGLSIYGKKLQKKSEASQEQLKAGAQVFSILVIDKKRMRLTDAGFPQVVIDQTPKYLRKAKVPVVKAKIGPKVASLMCDEKIFDLIPVKKEVKAVMNGIYIIDVKGMRGGLDNKPVKKKFFARMKDKLEKKVKENETSSKKTSKKAQ